MKKLIPIIVILMGCSTSPAKKDIVIYEEKEKKTYRADCRIDDEVFSEDNLVLQKEENGKFIFKAADGKVLGLPQDSCFLTQQEVEETFPKDEPKQRWVKCKLGKLSFVSDSLIYLKDEKHYYSLKRRDGQVFVLPRYHCSIYHYTPE